MGNKVFVRTIAALVLIFLVLPTFIVIPLSFSSSKYMEFPPPGFSLQWYESFFNNPMWMDSLWLSIKVGIGTMILATIIGTMASVTLARVKNKFTEFLYFLFIIPMVIPLIIVAIVVYSLFIRMNLQGSYFGLVLAHTIIAIPYVITTVLGALKSYDIRIEQAAISLGAHPLKAFLKVTVPVISPALVSGALFAFVTSFDELIIAIFISDTFTKTLPVKMWEDIRMEIDPTLAALASILIGISILIFAIMEIYNWFSRKKIDSL